MLEAGAVRSDERVLRTAYANGIRIFDTAKVYGTEKNFKKWFEQTRGPQGDLPRHQGHATHAQGPAPNGRRAARRLGTDYIDLFFIHGLGDERTVDESINMVTSQEFKETADAIRKSGKAKFVGFSTHNKDRARSSRPPPRQATSTRSCFSTGHGSKKIRRSTRRSMSAGRTRSA